MNQKSQASTSSTLLVMALAAGFTITAFPMNSQADSPPEAPPAYGTHTSVPSAAMPSSGHKLAFTLSPAHLALPMLEVSIEYAVMDNFGIALIAGYGAWDQAVMFGDIVLAEDRVTMLEFGLQPNYYVLGDFNHGMQIGAEIMTLFGSVTRDYGGVDEKATATALAVGPYLGYKVAASFGLTFVAQLGYQNYWIVARGDEVSTTNADGSVTIERTEATEEGGSVLLNLNIGWSF